MKRQAPEIAGHETQRESLHKLLLAGRLPHAFIFSGTRGVGKSLVAAELARTLVCHKNFPRSHQHALPDCGIDYGGCLACPSCVHSLHGSHPDLHIVSCANRDESSVSQMRELLYSLNLAAFEAANRVVILDDADVLLPQAANVLLKSLEEPRSGVYFILISASPAKLLRTIQSRCHTIFFDRLSKDDVFKVISQHNKTAAADGSDAWPDADDEIVLLADGSLDNISRVAQERGNWQEVLTKLDAIAQGDSGSAVSFARSLAAKRDALRDMLHLLRIAARLRLKENSACDAAAAWALFVSNVIAAERLIFERNLAALTVITALLSSFAQACRNTSFSAYSGSSTLLEKVVVS